MHRPMPQTPDAAAAEDDEDGSAMATVRVFCAVAICSATW